jgi:hypothetical protein
MASAFRARPRRLLSARLPGHRKGPPIERFRLRLFGQLHTHTDDPATSREVSQVSHVRQGKNERK